MQLRYLASHYLAIQSWQLLTGWQCWQCNCTVLPANANNVWLDGNDFIQLKLDDIADNADYATALSSQSHPMLTMTIYSIVNCSTGCSNHMHLMLMIMFTMFNFKNVWQCSTVCIKTCTIKYLANVNDVYNDMSFEVTIQLMSLETLSTLAFLTI